MKNAIALALLSLLIPSYATALSIHLPRSPSPKGGGGGGGGGRGGGGGGGSRGGSSGSSGGSRGAGNTGLGGSGNTGKPAVITTTGGSNQGRSANYFSGGGGKPFTLDSSNAFAGRQMGGGTRDQVTGTPRYGSGYPYYGAGYPYVGVVGQPFPFGFWPVYWGGHGHGGEYHRNSSVNSQRPGGNLTMVELVPINGSSWSTSAVNGINETYWMIGDYESVTTLLSILVYPANDSSVPYGCSCQNRTPSAFDTDNNSTNITVRFENVLQWYRSSSFALAYAGYNNTNALAPLNETGTLGWNDSIPFPDQQQNSAFLHCINNTITAALPILDAPPSKGGLSGGAIAGIVIGSIVGAILFGIAVRILYRRRQLREGKGKKGKSKTKSSDSKHAKEASTAPLVEDSTPTGAGGWVGGFFNKKKGPNTDEDDKPDIDGKKGHVHDEKKEKKGPVDEHKEKSSHRDTESDESPNAGISFPEPKAY